MPDERSTSLDEYSKFSLPDQYPGNKPLSVMSCNLTFFTPPYALPRGAVHVLIS